MKEGSTLYDVAVIGGGIVGLSCAAAIVAGNSDVRIAVLEKEDSWASHQTGRNSGVIHSGIYYKPGSRKAQFARAGSQSMADFCRSNRIEYEICGKVIVATRPSQLDQLEALYEQGRGNGLNVQKLTAKQLRQKEPYCAGIAALHVPSAGIVNYGEVCDVLVDQLGAANADLLLNQRVRKIVVGNRTKLVTDTDTVHCSYVVNCAGLHSDRVARLDATRQTSGVDDGFRIVPFRGEYYQLKASRSYLVNNLIYPVPNPDFPFLGVHFTRMIDGHIEAGPNAVLATKREGYNKSDINIRDIADTFGFPGFWKLAAAHWREGGQEMLRSASKRAFTKSLQELIPDVEASDLVKAPAGVRAQALRRDGTLEDDFQVTQTPHSLHVGNAPSPAATASLEIGTYIASHLKT